MIIERDLLAVLKKYHIEEKYISKILKNKHIYTRKDINGVEEILKVLENHSFIYLVYRCTSILARGKSSEIAKIIKVLLLFTAMQGYVKKNV